MNGPYSKTLGQALAVLVATLVAIPPEAWAGRGGGGRGGGSRGSVRSVNRSSSGNGGSWSGGRTSGSTERTRSGDSSYRQTEVQGKNGRSAAADRSVTKDGDTVTVDRGVTTSGGKSVDKSKEYQLDDGRVESVERDVTASNRSGQTANWQGKAEREGAGWEFEGEGKNRYGQEVEAKGYAANGPYGRGAVADVEGGRYGDRTVGAYKPYGSRGHVSTLPAGYRPYNYHGRPYYGYGGAYYRPFPGGYYPVPPPWGYCCYHDDDLVAAFALTIAGAALLYSDGAYYEKTYVEGEEQYKVIAPPQGASLPQAQLPPDAPTVTVAGTVYYLYGNTFYKTVISGGQLSYVVIAKPAGVTSIAAVPADVQAKAVGDVTYLVAGGKHYLPYLDASGKEEYVLVDPPGGGAAAAPAQAAKTVALSVPAGTAIPVRLASEVGSGTHKTGTRFKANLEKDLVVGGLLVAARGTTVYGRVAEAVAGTGTGKAPKLALELTDIELGGKVFPVVSNRVQAEGEGSKAGRKVLGTAAIGAGIGAAIDGGEGAAWGAGIGAVAGVAAASKSEGNQIAFAAGTSMQFQLAQAVTLERAVAVASK